MPEFKKLPNIRLNSFEIPDDCLDEYTIRNLSLNAPKVPKHLIQEGSQISNTELVNFTRSPSELKWNTIDNINLDSLEVICDEAEQVFFSDLIYPVPFGEIFLDNYRTQNAPQGNFQDPPPDLVYVGINYQKAISSYLASLIPHINNIFNFYRTSVIEIFSKLNITDNSELENFPENASPEWEDDYIFPPGTSFSNINSKLDSFGNNLSNTFYNFTNRLNNDIDTILNNENLNLTRTYIPVNLLENLYSDIKGVGNTRLNNVRNAAPNVTTGYMNTCNAFGVPLIVFPQYEFGTGVFIQWILTPPTAENFNIMLETKTITGSLIYIIQLYSGLITGDLLTTPRSDRLGDAYTEPNSFSDSNILSDWNNPRLHAEYNHNTINGTFDFVAWPWRPDWPYINSRSIDLYFNELYTALQNKYRSE